MLIVVGVAHVFDLAKQIENIITEKEPNIVGVELDYARYLALKEQRLGRDLSPPYKLLATFQRRIASKYGVKVGSEMLAAVETAEKLNIPIAFVDLDGLQVFRELWKSMSLGERLKFIFGGFLGLLVKKERLEKELKKFEKNYDQYIEIFGNEFPTAKRILIDRRNEYMAQRLRNLCSKHEIVLAVVGEGHLEGLKRLLSDLELEIIRLSELRKTSVKSKTTSEVSIGYTLHG